MAQVVAMALRNLAWEWLSSWWRRRRMAAARAEMVEARLRLCGGRGAEAEGWFVGGEMLNKC